MRLFLWYLSDQDLAILTNKLASTKNIYNADDIFGSNIEIAEEAINQAVRLIKDNEVKRIYTIDFNEFKSLQIPASEFSWVKNHLMLATSHGCLSKARYTIHSNCLSWTFL